MPFRPRGQSGSRARIATGLAWQRQQKIRPADNTTTSLLATKGKPWETRLCRPRALAAEAGHDVPPDRVGAGFSREDFIYDEMRDIYTMPGGQGEPRSVRERRRS